jgi:hypothetical protein
MCSYSWFINGGVSFVNEKERVICPDLFWENYQLIFDHAYHGKIDTYPTFVDNCRFNIEGLKDKIQESGIGKKIVILNFPNNPTGYTVTVQEAEEIRKILVEEVDRGSEIVVFIDDAYFGLVFEQGILAESMFSLLADAHERSWQLNLTDRQKRIMSGFQSRIRDICDKNSIQVLYIPHLKKNGRSDSRQYLQCIQYRPSLCLQHIPMQLTMMKKQEVFHS